MTSSITAIDYNLLMQIHSLTGNAFFDQTMPIISAMGNLGTIWIIFSLLLLLKKEYRVAGLLCILALLITTIAGEGILKHLVLRPRPFEQYQGIQLLIKEPVSSSFPSGHTASSFAFAFVIAGRIKKAAVPAFIMAAAIAFSRLYLMVHYPTDIIAGILLAFICAKITELIYERFILKKGLSTL